MAKTTIKIKFVNNNLKKTLGQLVMRVLCCVCVSQGTQVRILPLAFCNFFFFLVFYLCFSLTSQTQTQNLKSLFQNGFPNTNPKSNIKSDSKEIFKAFVSKHTNLQISSNKLISLSELIQTT